MTLIEEAKALLDACYDAVEATIGPVPGRADPYPDDVSGLLARIESVNGLVAFAASPGAWPIAVDSLPAPKQVGGWPNFTPSDFARMEIDWAMTVPRPEAPSWRTADSVRRLKQARKAKGEP